MIQIILGTAAGPGSERAASWTADLTRVLNGDLEIIAGYARRSAEESPDIAHELHDRSAHHLKRWAVDQQLADVQLRTMERAPDEALALAAQDEGADLVVIGSEDEEGVTSFGFGSIAHRLAHHLHCPLIVVPHGDIPIEGGTLVVGVDGSRGSELALQWASALGSAIGGRVVAVCNVDASDDLRDDSGAGAPGDTSSAKQVRVDGGASIELIERGGTDPAETLREVAAELDAALIVVSAKRHHSLGGLLLGAVADHLLHRPSRPVAVLPHGYGGWSATPTPPTPRRDR
jgi:nucleotide-binding universal stress UspA family protein